MSESFYTVKVQATVETTLLLLTTSQKKAIEIALKSSNIVLLENLVKNVNITSITASIEKEETLEEVKKKKEDSGCPDFY
jgi:hypothetical protein